MNFENLENLFTSEVAIFVVMAVGIIWLARKFSEERRRNNELCDKIIRHLELRIAATTGKNTEE